MSDSVTLWLDAAGRQPIPTYAEQIQLGNAIQRGQADDSTAREKKSGRRALNRLVSGNLRLVLPIARKYCRAIEGPGCSLELIDLLQEGAIGLQIAATKFDPTRGYRFSTMAYWWCQQAIQRLIQQQRGAIRIPLGVQDLCRRWAQRGDQTLDEFVTAWPQYKYNAAKVADALAVMSSLSAVCSLDQKVHEGGSEGSSLLELLADEQQPDLDALHYTMTMEQLEAAPETRDAIAALQLAETSQRKEMALLLGVRPKDVSGRLDDLRAVVREHCNNEPTSEPEPMTATNGHATLDRLIDDVQNEQEPEPVAKRRGRRTRAEIDAANTANQPALVTVAIGGMDISGTPQSLAAVIRELQQG